MSIRNKMLSTDLETWDHPRRTLLVLPLFGALGVFVGSVVLQYFIAPSLWFVAGAGVSAACGVLLGGFVSHSSSAQRPTDSPYSSDSGTYPYASLAASSDSFPNSRSRSIAARSRAAGSP